MSFIDGLRAAMLANAETTNTETARWGLLVGSVAVVGKEVWAILPVGSVVAFAVAMSRQDLDQLLEAVSDQVTRGQ
jgi:non-ribosomal peptide synthetase component F